MSLPVEGLFHQGDKTENAGTAITVFIPGMKNRYTYVKRITYTTAGTLHTITVMRKIAETTLSSAAAAAQAVINLTADPGSIAANDLLGIQKPDGSWHFGTVSSVATLAITLTANVPTGGFSSGARVVFFGVAGDTDHSTMTHRIPSSQTRYQLPTSTEDTDAVAGSKGTDEPVILSSNNATNAGRFDLVEALYSRVPTAFPPT